MVAVEATQNYVSTSLVAMMNYSWINEQISWY